MEKTISPSSIAMLGHVVSALEARRGDIPLGLSESLNISAPKSGSSTSSISRVKKSLRNAEELRDVLEMVLAASQDIVADLSKVYNTISIQHGIDRIPDDTLCMIFEYAHVMNESPTPEMLSLVNRRFRKVALRMPKLWTHISSRRDSPSKIAALVARSSPRTLSVVLEGRSQSWNRRSEEGHKREAAFLLASFKLTAVSSADRLGSLELVFDMDIDRDIICLESLQNSYQHLRFPVLQTLDITFKLRDRDDETWEEIIHFYHTWDLPSLRSLKARNFIPQFLNQIPSQLVSCFFELDHDVTFFDGGGWDLDDAAQFLGSLENVEELEFSLHYQSLLSPNDEETPFDFPKLRRLSLTFGLDGIESCTNFFSRFNCPDVSSIALDVVIPAGVTPGASLCAVLRCFEGAREAEDVAIKFRHELNREGVDTFFDHELEDLVGNGYFNRTKNFRVDYAISQDDNEAFFDFSKKVRSFRIEDCEGEVNGLLGMLGERTNDFQGNAEDGTCLLVNQSILQNWEEKNGGKHLFMGQ